MEQADDTAGAMGKVEFFPHTTTAKAADSLVKGFHQREAFNPLPYRSCEALDSTYSKTRIGINAAGFGLLRNERCNIHIDLCVPRPPKHFS